MVKQHKMTVKRSCLKPKKGGKGCAVKGWKAGKRKFKLKSNAKAYAKRMRKKYGRL